MGALHNILSKISHGRRLEQDGAINSRSHTTIRATPSGVTLGGKYFIGSFLRDDKYAKVYEVACNSTSSQLEARFYTSQILASSRAQRYRRRNKQRLMSRSVYETKWENQTVIVYITGKTNFIANDSIESNMVSIESAELESADKRAETFPLLDSRLGHKLDTRREAER